jgi:MFS family permease
VLKLLRQRNFGLLWCGGLISLTGDRVLSTALPFYVYQQTGSTLATGGMILAAIVPRLLFGSIAGVQADRWNRKHTMIAANVSRAVILLALFLMPKITWMIYLVVFLEATLSAFFEPAENALLPELVGEDKLLTANSLNALNNTLARLIGPPIGGALLGLSGLGSVILIDIASYLLAALLITGVEDSRSGTRRERRSDESMWREGLAMVRNQIAALFAITGLITFAGTMLDPLYVPFVNDILQGDALVMGWLLMAQGIGGIVGGLVIGQWGHKLIPVYLLAGSAISAGLMLLVVFNFPSLYLAIGIHFLLGLPLVGTRTAIHTLLQMQIPDAYRGRIYGTLTMTGALLELIGVGLTGALGDVIGILPLLNLSAGLTLAAGIITLFKALR